MGKLDKLKQLRVKVPDVSNVVRIHAKPDRYAILTGKFVAFTLAPGRYRHLMAPNVLDTQLAFLKGVVDIDSWRDKCTDQGFRGRAEKIEAKLFPGLMTHVVLRKRRIEEYVRAEIAKGCRQLVSFGAGYDTLLPRLADEFPDLTCIEADLLSTQRSKIAVLRTRPRNLHFVDINLAEPYLEKVMTEATPFNKRERTCFIAEGVLMWLEDDDVERLLTFMQDFGALGSKFIFTFLERGVDHKAYIPEVSFLSDAVLKLYKVRFGWGVRIEHISRYLNDRYFGLIEVESPDDLRHRAPQPIPPCAKRAFGDHLAIAELVFIDEGSTGTGPRPHA
jgi:methyltransferase (TIGR00027 family)